MRGFATGLVMSLALVPVSASAVVNGGFESSLTGWSVFPLTGVNPIRASAETAGFGITPTEGRFQGVIETSDIDGKTATEIEAFFGLSAGAISGFGQASPRGIAISQTVNVGPGDTLLGDINFLTNELVQGDPGYTTSPHSTTLRC